MPLTGAYNALCCMSNIGISEKGVCNMELVYKYLKRKRNYRKLKDRNKNVQVNYIWIAKATGLTYKQVRRAVDNLCISGRITRYHTYDEYHRAINWYKISTGISTDDLANIS